MKCYRNTETGVFYRTQAEAKAAGPFEPVDIPTSHQELVDFCNSLREPAPEPEPVPDRPYRNGDPTVPYLKSRDPMARFTCRACGVVNTPSLTTGD